MKELVSVIIPLYNAADHIVDAVRSCEAQTWPHLEIIVIDDGSTDDSYARAKTLEGGNVRVIRQPNRGAAAARNRGLSVSSGSYIQFLDADDLLGPEKISGQMELLRDRPDMLATGPTVHFMDGSDPYQAPVPLDWYRDGTADTADFLVKLYGGSLVGPEYGGMVALHAWLIPRELIDRAGPWNEELSLDDDGEFMCRVILAARGIVYAPAALTYYRKYLNGRNISSATSFKAHQSLLTSAKLRMGYLLNKRNDDLTRLALSRVLDEIAVSFYPEYPALTTEAEKLARQMSSKSYHQPYRHFPANLVSTLFGWRTMKKVSRIKQSWTIHKTS